MTAAAKASLTRAVRARDRLARAAGERDEPGEVDRARVEFYDLVRWFHERPGNGGRGLTVRSLATVLDVAFGTVERYVTKSRAADTEVDAGPGRWVSAQLRRSPEAAMRTAATRIEQAAARVDRAREAYWLAVLDATVENTHRAIAEALGVGVRDVRKRIELARQLVRPGSSQEVPAADRDFLFDQLVTAARAVGTTGVDRSVDF